MNVNTEILKLWQSRGENERTGSDAERVADIPGSRDYNFTATGRNITSE
ncbi:hypothetical protein DFO55_12049 [Grimontella sp. AG753]|nr:hypothetical protein DFO55_12049 [Grimontella sp. AG753]